MHHVLQRALCAHTLSRFAVSVAKNVPRNDHACDACLHQPARDAGAVANRIEARHGGAEAVVYLELAGVEFHFHAIKKRVAGVEARCELIEGTQGFDHAREVPVRQILEQLVAKTGLPPFLLGLSWSSTERMSSQQADMLTSEITALRRTLTPMVERVCRLWLRLHGYGCRFAVEWDDINLQDLVEEAKAELYREQARRLRLENDEREEQT